MIRPRVTDIQYLLSLLSNNNKRLVFYEIMHVDFDPLLVDWNFFTIPIDAGTEGISSSQTGGGGATIMGSGAAYPVFTGMPYQRGAGGGIGSVFRSLWRFILPIGRQVSAAVGRQGLESGARVLSNLLDGKELKETLVSEGRSGLKNLLDKASENLGKQKGTGGSFDFKRYKRNLNASSSSSSAMDTEQCSGIGNFNDGKKGIKRRLLSTLGPFTTTTSSINSQFPSLLPNRRRKKGSSKRRSVQASNTTGRKRTRVDAFGPY